MIEVKVRHNNVEKALRIFKRKIKDSGLFIEIKEREYYRKPSVIKNRKKGLGKVRSWLKQREINSECCGEPPTTGLREKIKQDRNFRHN
jgi:small subunit ribosomal protein S21